MIYPEATKRGNLGSEVVTGLIGRDTTSFLLTKRDENEALERMGVSAVVSKGEERARLLRDSLEVCMELRFSGYPLNEAAMKPWQKGLDRATVDTLRRSMGPQAIKQFHGLAYLWRNYSPFTVIDGSIPQRPIQYETSAAATQIRNRVQIILDRHNVRELTLYKPMQWESGGQNNVPLSDTRPDWYSTPSGSSGGFTESESDNLDVKTGLFAPLSSMTANREIAYRLARHTPDGRPASRYAVLSATIPASAVVSIPSFGFGSVARAEIVVDTTELEGEMGVTLGMPLVH